MKKDTRQTKIAVVTAVDMTFKVGLFAQIKAAQDKGFVVHGVCTKGPNFAFLCEQDLRMHPVTIKRCISPLTDLVALWRMWAYFRRESMTIVHTHTPKCSLLGQLAAKFARVPVIVNTLHGFYFHENMKPWVRRFYIIMEWIAARCSSMILSQNPEDIETAVELGICSRDRIRVLGNGIDLSRFDPARFDGNFKREKRREIGVPDDAIVVGIMGRLVKEKGYLELFEAMQRIMAGNDKVWLVVIGPEEPEKADRISVRTLREFGIETKTRWLGSRDDIPELLACCDIYCLPSWREGLPRSAIEAAAMGLPIVATNIRGCRQVVEEGSTGVLVPVRDSAALASAIDKLAADKGLRLALGRTGYEKARREFDERKVCEIVLDTYDRLLAENRRGTGIPRPGGGLRSHA